MLKTGTENIVKEIPTEWTSAKRVPNQESFPVTKKKSAQDMHRRLPTR
jgi:hypothetical protein